MKQNNKIAFELDPFKSWPVFKTCVFNFMIADYIKESQAVPFYERSQPHLYLTLVVYSYEKCTISYDISHFESPSHVLPLNSNKCFFLCCSLYYLPLKKGKVV